MENDGSVPVHPVQTNPKGGWAPQVVALRAYEVYAAVCGPQEAIIEDDCRGGFGLGELAAYLYARSFPRDEWHERVDEASSGMNLDCRRRAT